MIISTTRIRYCLLAIALAATLAACTRNTDDAPANGGGSTDQAESAASTSSSAAVLAAATALEIDFEKYTLDNGLEVILHRDHSDPVVAVASIFHVGSNREEPGRTGFAHFFEHMSFNDSENVPRGANRKYIEELGGSRNGGTWSDGTIYYEVSQRR